MAPPKLDLSLYLVTDSSLLPLGRSLADHVRASIKGGVTIVQLREKTLGTAAFIKLGKEIHAITKELGVPLLINDRADVAKVVGCEGVHIGWDDIDYESARNILGPDAIIGLSVSNDDQLVLALKVNPTYLGLGSVYATATKPDAGTLLGALGVRSLLEKIPEHIPTVAIGGINLVNLQSMFLTIGMQDPHSGSRKPKLLDGVAVVSAIITSMEPEKTCRELKELMSSSRAESAWDQSLVKLIPRLLPSLQRVRTYPPLIHHITNHVSSALSANVTLAIGASPIMSDNPAEFKDIAALNNGIVALVLNMGTFSGEATRESPFILALDAHNELTNFVVFDPVGCGATTARRAFAEAIIHSGGCRVIKGNEGEILSIAGQQVVMRGVDGAGQDGGKHRERELAEICTKLAKKEEKIIVMTGATDIVSDGQKTYLLRNGDPIQTRVTGIGCALSSFIAATISGSRLGEEIVAVIAAISAFNVAAEKANAAPKPAGPASWAVRFLDILAAGPQSGFETDVKIEEIIV